MSHYQDDFSLCCVGPKSHEISNDVCKKMPYNSAMPICIHRSDPLGCFCFCRQTYNQNLMRLMCPTYSYMILGRCVLWLIWAVLHKSDCLYRADAAD